VIILDFAVESGVDLHRYVCVDDVSVPLESSKQGNSSNLEKLLNSLEVGCTWVTAGVQRIASWLSVRPLLYFMLSNSACMVVKGS